MQREKYIMTYFHPRDFDYDQPIIEDLNTFRRFKSYYGLKNSYIKAEKYLDDFDLLEEMTHVSTGGGASLELLSGNQLPALKVLEN